jgi:hypothetical protein
MSKLREIHVMVAGNGGQDHSKACASIRGVLEVGGYHVVQRTAELPAERRIWQRVIRKARRAAAKGRAPLAIIVPRVEGMPQR